MNITLTGKKISIDERILAFKKDNLTAQMTFTVDTDDSWVYKLDVRLPVKCCTGEELFNIIDLPMDTNRTCTIDVTAAMVPLTGKYTMQLRGISGEQVYHSDTFEVWVKYSIDPGVAYDPVPSEFYQIEQNVTEMNNHPPKPGQNGYWLVWDITTSQYKESDIPLPDGMLPEVTADTSGKYLSNDGKKAYWAEVQAGTEGKIDKIEVNNVEQPIIDKTVNIAVPTKTSDLSNDSGYITNEALDGYATKAELPTKVSQLENDSKFINESALDGYAKTDDIPTKTSQLNNDANYITAAQAPVQSVNNKTGAVSLTASDVSAIQIPQTASVGQVLAVKVVDENGKPTEWEPVTLPEQVQADWNQNDISAADYVKNRTHYEESSYVDYVLNGDGIDIVGFSLPEVGETTTVKINGVESVETVKEAESSLIGGSSYKYIGNTDWDSLLTGGTGWCVIYTQGMASGLANPDTEISVEGIVVHKINDKFINFDGFVRTFDYHFKDCTLYRTLYDDDGNGCMLYMCNNFILPKQDSQLLGFMTELGISRVGSVNLQSCFVTGAIINSMNGSIEIRNVVLGTDTSEMEELAADYGFTHTTNPKA